MREIAAETNTEAIRDMCIEANYGLAPDMRKVFEKQWRRRNPSGPPGSGPARGEPENRRRG